jgi:hypothetical protein
LVNLPYMEHMGYGLTRKKKVDILWGSTILTHLKSAEMQFDLLLYLKDSLFAWNPRSNLCEP